MKVLPLGRKSQGRLWKDQGASELVEFAVILPVLMMVLMGMYWFGRAYNIYETMTRAAKEGAAYGARPACALCSVPCGVVGQFPCADDVANNVVVPALNAAHINPSSLVAIAQPPAQGCSRGLYQSGTQCPVSGTGGGATCTSAGGNKTIWVCYCIDMNQGANPPECGVSVTMAYPWKFTFPFTGLDNLQINIPASAQVRQEF